MAIGGNFSAIRTRVNGMRMIRAADDAGRQR